MRRIIVPVLCLLLLFTISARADAAENQEIIYTYLTETLSLSRAAACGILSNIKSESGFRPEAVGDSGNAYGICQWNSRRQALVNFCEENGYESWESLSGQLDYLAYELENNKKSVGTYLKTIPDTAQGAYDAAWYFCVYYEIPANRYDKGVTRGRNAVVTFFPQYGGEFSTYAITYDANGGSTTPAAGKKTEGVPYAITSFTPVRDGYQLVGWSEDRDGASPIYQPGDFFADNREATFYAVWQRQIDADTPSDGKAVLNGHTYEFFSGAFSWSAAQAFAAARGGYLATVRGEEEYRLVSSLISEAENPCWLGGKFACGNWTWVSDETFSDDFASNYWQSGQPAATVGASARGCLAQSPAGGWLDLASDSGESGGLVVEYGAAEEEDFPLYLITVSTTLNLRNGPKTTYDKIGALTPGQFLSVRETENGWGWGVTDTGLSGWCSMNADYMTRVDLVDARTGLALANREGTLCVLGLTCVLDELTIPGEVDGLPVTAIAAKAFTRTSSPARVLVPETVTEIAPGAFSPDTIIRANAGSPAHFAAVTDGCALEMVLPETVLTFSPLLTAVEAEAFRGNASLKLVNFSLSPLERIESGAFRDCPALKVVLLPATVSFIAEDAFDPSVVLVCAPGSVADQWAKAHDIAAVAYSGR